MIATLSAADCMDCADLCNPCHPPLSERGAATIYFVLFLTAISGLLVMATDVGRLYVIQGELQTAADAAALAAATRLVGTANATSLAMDQLTASFDAATGNDNRFNLRLNQIGAGGSDLLTSRNFDYFATLLDAQNNANGGQTGSIDWSSGAYPKYVRIQITAESPTLFLPLLNRAAGRRPTVAVSAVAGISGPMCSACGIDGMATVAIDTSDTVNYGFTPGGFYTLFLTRSQRPAGVVTPAPLQGTSLSVQYAILNHVPSGPSNLDLEGSLFEIGASGLSSSAGLTPSAYVTIDTTEAGYPDLQGTVGQDVLCGLNIRFAVQPQNNCTGIAGGEFMSLAPLFTADTDVGGGSYAAGDGLQDYASEYDGNFRRVLTLAVVDGSDSLNVLNFRQFLIEMSPPSATVTQGLNTALATGAFRAQYIGASVPLRCGSVGGVCRVSLGVGRVVLH